MTRSGFGWVALVLAALVWGMGTAWAVNPSIIVHRLSIEIDVRADGTATIVQHREQSPASKAAAKPHVVRPLADRDFRGVERPAHFVGRCTRHRREPQQKQAAIGEHGGVGFGPGVIDVLLILFDSNFIVPRRLGLPGCFERVFHQSGRPAEVCNRRTGSEKATRDNGQHDDDNETVQRRMLAGLSEIDFFC